MQHARGDESSADRPSAPWSVDVLAEVEQRLAVAFDHAPIGMATISLGGTILEANPQLCSLLGYSRAELQQRSIDDVVHPADRERGRLDREWLRAGVAAVTRADERYVTASGRAVWTRRVASLISSTAGEPVDIVMHLADTTDERSARDELRRALSTDPLTSLPNSAAVLAGFEAELAERPASLLLVDLDDFRSINETMGREAGDQVLATFAQRLEAIARPEEVGRLGGDEFVVATPAVDPEELLQLAQRILDGTARALDVDGRTVLLTASIGVATGDRGSSVKDVVRQAATAVGTAKGAGGYQAIRLSPGGHAAGPADSRLEAALGRAVAAGTLVVHYQPIRRVADGALTGVEALCRWHDPERGSIAPEVFIPLAERSGLIHDLGAQVLQRAIGDIAEVGRRTGHPLALAVNVSALQLSEPAFPRIVAEALAEARFPAKHLTVEITESALAAPGLGVDAALAELRLLGIRLALDDFGTGYSSLGRLRATPFDTIKIDRSFLADITDLEPQGPLATAAIALGHALGATVVAEGIETPRQLERIHQLDCEFAQGYLLGRPQPVNALAPYLDPTQPPPAPLTTDLPAAADTAGGPRDRRRRHEPLVRHLLGRLQQATALESVFLTRIDWRRGLQRLEVVHNAGDLDLSEGLEVDWTSSLCRRAILAGAPLDDAAADPACGIGATQIGRHIAVPVNLDDGTTYGTLCGASSTPGPIGPTTERVFTHFANLIARYLDTGAAAG